MSYEKLDSFKETVDQMFLSVGQTIGIHVMLLVVEHALWKTRQKCEEAALVRYSEEGIFLEGLAQLEPENAKLVILEFVASIVATLERLIGAQLARQLTEQLLNDLLDGEE
ncbi:MAG TPA: hypothetical protein VMW83_08465 [Spirochaetia bacterium]|nr:hypothetical protein [Spirochaetia bacterium]